VRGWIFFGGISGIRGMASIHTTTAAGRETGGIRVFLGSYIHSESKDKPLIVKPNGVIGVQNGKVIKIN